MWSRQFTNQVMSFVAAQLNAVAMFFSTRLKRIQEKTKLSKGDHRKRTFDKSTTPHVLCCVLFSPNM